MRILLDHCIDIRFRVLLDNHDVICAKQMGWEQLSNGKLLASADAEGFQAFITVDKNLRHQQNIGKLNMMVVTLLSRRTALEDITPFASEILEVLEDGFKPGTSYVLAAKTSD